MSSFLYLGLVVTLTILLPWQSEGTRLRDAFCLDNMGPNGPSLEAFSGKGRELSLCVKEYRQRYTQDFECGRNLRDKTCIQIKDHFQSFVDDLRRCLTGPPTSTTPSTLNTPTTSIFLPRDCQDEFGNGIVEDTVITIYPDGVNAVNALCSDGGTVFFNRLSPESDFHKTYNEYEVGFGTPGGDQWLGNRQLFSLLSTHGYKLLVNLTTADEMDLYVVYDNISTAGPSDFYRLGISGFSGNTEIDALKLSNNEPFSTGDTAFNSSYQGVAAILKGGFWFSNSLIDSKARVTADDDPTIPFGYSWESLSLSSARFTLIKK